MGILVTATAAIVLAISMDLSAIASIGSAVALVVFTLVTFGHLRIRQETGTRTPRLLLANLTTIVVLGCVRLHHAGRRAQYGRRAGRDPDARHRSGLLEAAPELGTGLR
jgi:hypothetical protein